MKNFQTNIASNATFELGAFRKLREILGSLGHSKPAVLIDEGFAKTELWEEVRSDLESNLIKDLFVFENNGSQEPTYNYLREVVAQFRRYSFDSLVGIGGGSAMDTAKAVAALQTNPGDPIEYRGFDQLTAPPVPTILVPTTAGTGSEASFNASFVDTDSRRKMGINGRHMFAKHAIIDPETTLSCPYKPALGAAVDAFVHAIEGFVCKGSNPVSDALAIDAISRIAKALPSLKHDPSNLDARMNLLIGAHFGGIIQMNSGSGIAAAISYPLSAYYKAPHGIGGGMFSLSVVKFNIDAGYYKYAKLAPHIGVGSPSSSDKENSLAVWGHLSNLWSDLDVPRSLRDFGIDPSERETVLERMKTQQPAFDQNAIDFTVDKDLPALMEPFFR